MEKENNNLKKARELVSKLTIKEKIGQLVYNAPAIERLGIPAYTWWNEALHGVARTGRATTFPQPIGLAASFDVDMLEKIGCAVADEMRAKYYRYQSEGDTSWYKGVNVWSPNINVFRDPRWGRGHETYGEDPFLTALSGTAYVKGLQGDDEQVKIGATLKHYAVHSGPELTRDSFNSVVNNKDLFETYLYAFKKCIQDAHPTAVMSSYNAVNGVPASANEYLLEEILRGKFGFDGYVVTDCGAVCWICDSHKYVATKPEAAALALKAGIDLNCGNGFAFLDAALLSNMIEETDLDRALIRLFKARYDLGILGGEDKYKNISPDVIECEKHKKLNLKASENSFVLLKNNCLLPLKNSKDLRIAVIGCNADDREGILGNYNGYSTRVYSILDGINEVSKGRVTYSKGSNITTFDMHNPVSDAVITARDSDVIVYVCGLSPRIEGENGDAFNSESGGDKKTLDLPDVQLDLYDALKNTGKPIVVVNISGSCVLLDKFDKADAIVQAFYPGALCGKAFARLLFGQSDFGARLPITFYKSNDDLPDFEDYSMKNRTYRYFDKEVAFEFGFGLSYADIEYKDVNFDGKKITLTVTNKSDIVGYAVPQIYIESGLEGQPKKSLKVFEKVKLSKRETKTVKINVPRETYELYDDNGDVFFAKEYAVNLSKSANSVIASFKVNL